MEKITIVSIFSPKFTVLLSRVSTNITDIFQIVGIIYRERDLIS